jgi:DNA polymerase III subunit alpha
MIRPEHFLHLHCHSSHSTKDGSIPIRALVDKQVEQGSKACCVTDHGTMTGGWFLYDHIHNVRKHQDVKHIIGLEAYVSTTRDELNKFLADNSKVEDKAARQAERLRLAKKYHQILLAKNKTGYLNLVKIHNDGWENGFYYSPTTTKECIFANSEGLIATTTCLASLWNQAIIGGDMTSAEKEIYEWKEVFGEDFYVELQPTNLPLQKSVNVGLIQLANKTNTPMIVTNDVHYLEESDHEFHSILLNMTQLRKKADGESDVKLWEFGVDDLYMKSLDQMKQSWRTHHQSKEFNSKVFDGSVMEISNIVSKVTHYSLESEPLLPLVVDNPKIELQRRVIGGLKEKLQKGIIPKDQIQIYQERIIYELQVISALDAENYILLCNEITNYCHGNSIGVGLGRGSAPGSLILYLLGVTGIDPVRHKLLFERFLNRGRRRRLKI